MTATSFRPRQFMPSDLAPTSTTLLESSARLGNTALVREARKELSCPPMEASANTRVLASSRPVDLMISAAGLPAMDMIAKPFTLEALAAKASRMFAGRGG